MADGHGGRRVPANPAPASGPGRLSKRTDGGAASQKIQLGSGGAYGDRAALNAQQHGAAMAQQPSVAPMPAPAPQDAGQGGGTPPYGGVPFGAPTQRPDEPVTQGAASGPGAGPEVMNSAPTQQPDGYITSLLQGMSATDTTGTLAQLYLMAKQRGV